MSIAAYDLFKAFDSRMVDVPIRRTEFLEPFLKPRTEPAVPMTTRLTVFKSPTAYGIPLTNESSSEEQRREALDRRELTSFIFSHYQELEALLRQFNQGLRQVSRKGAKRGLIPPCHSRLKMRPKRDS